MAFRLPLAPIAAVHRTPNGVTCAGFRTLPVSNAARNLATKRVKLGLGFGQPSWPGMEQDRKVTGTTASGHGSPDSTLLTPLALHPGQAGWLERLDLRNLAAERYQARSKRSAFITLVHAATKSATNFASASSAP
jgi:hypothetical protein